MISNLVSRNTNLAENLMPLEAYSHFKLLFHVIIGRVQQKIQFSHFISGKMLNSIGN